MSKLANEMGDFQHVEFSKGKRLLYSTAAGTIECDRVHATDELRAWILFFLFFCWIGARKR